MNNLIDFFTKKPIEETEISYKNRKQACINATIANGRCDCVHCVDNDKLANKLAEISKWLMTDYSQKSQKRLYYGDWLEVVILAAMKVEKYINSLETKQ